MGNLSSDAVRYSSIGLAVMPCHVADKKPIVNWHGFKDIQPPMEMVQKWFSVNGRHIGIICGKASGMLEMFDFDNKGYPDAVFLFNGWKEMVEERYPGLVDTFTIETTQHGGFHVYYRCSEICGNKKLANRPPTPEELEVSPNVKSVCLIETRGQGGYVIAAPSTGYTIIQGSFETIPEISPEQRDWLWKAAMSFDQEISYTKEERVFVSPKSEEREEKEETRPGDAYNAAMSVGDIVRLMEGHGWTVFKEVGDAFHLTRPGKDVRCTSATVNYVPNSLYVWTTSSQFEPERAYSPFGVYAYLEHNGDFREAASALARQGYGSQKKGIAKFFPARKTDGTHEPSQSTKNEDIQFILECAANDDYGDTLLFEKMCKGRWVYDFQECSWFFWDRHCWKRDDTSFLRRVFAEQICEEYQKGLDWLQYQMCSEAEERDKELIYLEDRAEYYQKKVDEILSSGERDKTRLASLERILASYHKKIDKYKAGDNKKGKGDSEIESLVKHCKTKIKNLRTHKGNTGVCNFATSYMRMKHKWNSNSWLLPVENGVVDLRTGKLVEGQPEDYMRSACPVVFDPDAKAPRWEQFIKEISTSEDVALYMQKLFGYGATGEPADILVVLYGPEGRNGKSLLLKMIRKALGDFAGVVHTDVIADKGKNSANEGAAQPHIMQLFGKRIVFSSETSENTRLNEAMVKSLTGNDERTARPLYGNQISFMISHLMFLLTNHCPRASADDEAMWTRLRVIEFSKRFVDNPVNPNERKIDRDLEKDLDKELPGILNWIVQGCLRWQQEGEQPPESVRVATDAMRDDNNIVGDFLEECCGQGEAMKCRASLLYEEYTKWCSQNGYRPFAANKFGQRVSKIFKKSRDSNGNFYIGLGLLSSNTMSAIPIQKSSLRRTTQQEIIPETAQEPEPPNIFIIKVEDGYTVVSSDVQINPNLFRDIDGARSSLAGYKCILYIEDIEGNIPDTRSTRMYRCERRTDG